MPEPQTLEDLAFLYLACSHMTDGELSPEEMRTVAQKIHEWQPKASLEEVGGVLRQAMTAYRSHQGVQAKLSETKIRAERLRTSIGADGLPAVLSDLIAIANADGEVNAAEEGFILATARAFGLD